MIIAPNKKDRFIALRNVSKCTVTLTNINGEVVFNSIIENDCVQLNLARFKDACYIVSVSLGLRILERKLLIW